MSEINVEVLFSIGLGSGRPTQWFSLSTLFCKGKRIFQTLLENYPDFRKEVVKEMEDNLAELSGEYLFNYVVDTGLPIILEQRSTELDNNKFTASELLSDNGFTIFSLSTVY